MHGDQRKKVHCIVAKDVTFSPSVMQLFGRFFLLALPTKARILCLDSLLSIVA
jgi:hypothetical protein